MSIVKEYIKYIGQDININFNISDTDGLLGYQQEVDNLVVKTGESLINPVVDVETRRYKIININNVPTKLKFYFGQSLAINFLYAGFQSKDITVINNKILNSFFILDFYDTFDTYTQNKIFSTYLTKIGIVPEYTINSTNQFYYLEIPKHYIDSQNSINIVAYVKLSFYNASTGILSIFENNDITDAYSQQKMYFNVYLNKTNRTWRFATDIVNAYEVTGQYATKINDTITNFDNKQQVYPSGNTFQTAGGNYTTV